MRDESEHDDLYQALHNAIGAEVADLEIGATPVGAVMKAGNALRTKRRLTTVSGVAALAVLPVAAVAVFAGGTGGAGGSGGNSKLGPVQAGGTNHGKGPTTPTTPPMTTTPLADLIPSPTVTPPPRGIGVLYANPNPDDAYTVIAGGTIGGQHWRLVRDLFVAPVYVSPGPGPTNHLPMSQRGRAGRRHATSPACSGATARPGRSRTSEPAAAATPRPTATWSASPAR